MIEYKHKRTKKDELLWKLWLIKIKYRYTYLDYLKKLKVKYLCNKGYHKTSSNTRSLTNSKGESYSVSYIECSNCYTKFFTCREDREKWKRIDESFNDKIINSLKLTIEDDEKIKSKLHGKSKE